MIEHFFQCPYCWETISMLIDVSQNHQKYIEDCEVCCRPIQVEVQSDDREISSFTASNLEDL